MFVFIVFMIFRVGDDGNIFFWGLGPLPPTTTAATTTATITTTTTAAQNGIIINKDKTLRHKESYHLLVIFQALKEIFFFKSCSIVKLLKIRKVSKATIVFWMKETRMILCLASWQLWVTGSSPLYSWLGLFLVIGQGWRWLWSIYFIFNIIFATLYSDSLIQYFWFSIFSLNWLWTNSSVQGKRGK